MKQNQGQFRFSTPKVTVYVIIPVAEGKLLENNGLQEKNP